MNILVKKMGEQAIIPQCHNGDWTDLYVHAVEVISPLGIHEYYTMEDDIPENVKYKVVGGGVRLEKGTLIYFNTGNTVMLHLGVAMKMPEGFEGHLLPRSSTYKKTGLLMTNSMGIIDNAYCGDNDEWCAMMYATRNGHIVLGDRYHQFRIMEKCHPITFNEVDSMNCEDRGGYGSTDIK